MTESNKTPSAVRLQQERRQIPARRRAHEPARRRCRHGLLGRHQARRVAESGVRGIPCRVRYRHRRRVPQARHRRGPRRRGRRHRPGNRSQPRTPRHGPRSRSGRPTNPPPAASKAWNACAWSGTTSRPGSKSSIPSSPSTRPCPPRRYPGPWSRRVHRAAASPGARPPVIAGTAAIAVLLRAVLPGPMAVATGTAALIAGAAGLSRGSHAG